MPFPTALLYMFILYATGLAIFCVLAGLFLFANRRLRPLAPCVTFIYPATFLGGVFAVRVAWRLSVFLHGHSFWKWEPMMVLVFLLMGTTMSGLLGYALASRVARHFPTLGPQPGSVP